MISAEEVASEIQRTGLHVRPLRIFWVTMAGERDGFAQQVRDALVGYPVVCHVVRKPGFSDPNAVMRDVLAAMREVRGEIEALESVASGHKGVDIVLVSRRGWELADASSPLELPEWFPVQGGSIATVRIVDLTWSARVEVSDRIIATDDLHRLLYDLDVALLERLEEVMEEDHRRIQALWYRLWSQNVGDEEVRTELSRIRATLRKVRNPTRYRPSTAKRTTIVGRLWAHTNKTTPDDLPKTAEAMARALDLGAVRGADISFWGMLNRPANPFGEARTAWAFGLLVTVRSACQLVTACAHADDYPRYRSVMLKATSLDIRECLDAAVGILRGVSSQAE